MHHFDQKFILLPSIILGATIIITICIMFIPVCGVIVYFIHLFRPLPGYSCASNTWSRSLVFWKRLKRSISNNFIGLFPHCVINATMSTVYTDYISVSFGNDVRLDVFVFFDQVFCRLYNRLYTSLLFLLLFLLREKLLLLLQFMHVQIVFNFLHFLLLLIHLYRLI